MEFLGLPARAGKAVKHEATRGLVLRQPIGDHRDDDVVWDQFA